MAVVAAVEVWVVGRDDDLLQHVAAAEGVILDASDGARYIDTFEAWAIGEGTSVDELQPLVEHHLFEVLAAAESIATNLSERARADDAAQRVVVVAGGGVAHHACALLDS